MSQMENVKIYNSGATEAFGQKIELCFLYIDSIRLMVLQLSQPKTTAENFDEKKFFEMIDMLDDLIKTISDIYKTLKKNHPSNNFCAKKVQSLEIHLLFVLKALFVAKNKEDFFMLKDLLKYELVGNIIQWKIKIVPELKEIKKMTRGIVL